MSDLAQRLRARLGVPVTVGEVVAEGVRTCFLEAGEGPPLVLLHGAGGGALTFGPFLGRLAARRRVIAPDVVGYGDSDKPEAPYTRAWFSRWLRAFLVERGLREVDVVGHSQGGAIALAAAIDSVRAGDGRIARLGLMDPAGFGAMGPASPTVVLAAILQNVRATRWSFRAALGDENPLFDDAMIDYHVEVARSPGGGRVFWRGKGQVVSPLTDEEIASARLPVRVLWGERDAVFPLASSHRALSLLPDGALVTIPDAGHSPFLSDPERTARLLLDALEALRAIDSAPLRP